ncbi:MAG TPA: hypothetical protein VF006_28405 [Longimicrobium sp.]
MRIYQRLAALHPDLEVAERLAGQGLVSANHVAPKGRKHWATAFAFA